jgi:hypothetical protein
MPKRTTREAKPGELREIRILETLERLSRRPESRMDLQRLLAGLSPSGQSYAKHLITSGPSSTLSAAKACGLSSKEVEAAMTELENGLASLR